MRTPKQEVERALKLARKVARQAYVDAFTSRDAKQALRLLVMLSKLEDHGYGTGRGS